jgi:hypothetical protein
VRLEDFGLRFLAVADGPLSQADAGVVSKDVEHMEGIAIGVTALLAGLAIHRCGVYRLLGEQSG